MGKYISAFLGMVVSLQPTPLQLVADNAPGLASSEVAAVEEVRTVEIREQDEPTVKKVMTIWVTAYSSTPEETDDTPFITASNTRVRSGIVATNLLPFGTRVQIPEAFGEKVFVVEDRMHSRKTNHMDIWMSTKDAAKKFGIMKTEIRVLEPIAEK